jgi:hypothetical protein
MRTCLALVLLSFASTPVFADQSCDASRYPLSAPTERFTDNHDGTVTDANTHVTWMRCSVGQTWTGGTCDAVATPLSWQAAQDAAAAQDKTGFAGHTDWRLPRIAELAHIVERQCANPRTNIAVFPNTPPAVYWTASSRHGKGTENQAFILSFGAEGVGGDVKTVPHLARLMRPSS